MKSSLITANMYCCLRNRNGSGGYPRFFCVKINHKKKRIASFAIRYCDVSGKGTVGVTGQGKFKGVFAGGNVEETLADG